MSNSLICIVGPTASGKSALAVFLAKKYNGEIISADSRQIYRGINIGADQITKNKMQGITHHLLDIEDPHNQFSVVQYKQKAEKTLESIQEKNKTPFLVGGSGMYIDAIIYDISYPNIPADDNLRKELEDQTTEHLYSVLMDIDPNRASNIDKKNKRRIIRAIEINKHTKNPVPQKQEKNKKYRTLILGIQTQKDELYKKIENRFYETLKNGHQEEVDELNKKYKVNWQRIEDMGLNYKYMAYYLQNKITEQEMIEKSIQSIQQYSKRQIVWFKKNKDIQWITTKEQAIQKIDSFIK